MFTSPGTRAGRGESLGFFRKALTRMLGLPRGSILYQGANGIEYLGPSTDGFVLTTNGIGADPNWQSVGASTSQWATIIDINFATESNQTLSTDTTYNIGTDINGNNIVWTKVNSANDQTAMAVVNGSGLVIQPKVTTAWKNTKSAPAIHCDISTLIPTFYLDMPLRITMYLPTSNPTTSADASGFALDNLATGTNNTCIVQWERSGSAGTANTFNTGSIITGTTVTITNIAANASENCFQLAMPIGRFSAAMTGWGGAYSSGFPAQNAMRPFFRGVGTTASYTATQDFVTSLPFKLVIYACRTAAGGYSATVGRIRVEYKIV